VSVSLPPHTNPKTPTENTSSEHGRDGWYPGRVPCDGTRFTFQGWGKRVYIRRGISIDRISPNPMTNLFSAAFDGDKIIDRELINTAGSLKIVPL